MGDNTINPELLTVGVIRWKQVAKVLATERQEKFLVDNYLLKHNGVTINTIYIYTFLSIYLCIYIRISVLKQNITNKNVKNFLSF